MIFLFIKFNFSFFVRLCFNFNRKKRFSPSNYTAVDNAAKFNNANKQPNNEMNKAHLMEIKKYICENDGISYKLARDLQIELDNLDSDLTKHTDYYQDLLKLRAAMKVDE